MGRLVAVLRELDGGNYTSHSQTQPRVLSSRQRRILRRRWLSTGDSDDSDEGEKNKRGVEVVEGRQQ